MKRNFIIILTLVGMLTQAQIVGYVKAPVTVRTLMAVKGGLRVLGEGTMDVKSDGRLRLITSGNSELLVESPEKFILNYDDSEKYAQMIADADYVIPPASGITVDYKISASTLGVTGGATVQIGFPFEGYKLSDLRSQSGLTGEPYRYPLACSPGNCHPAYYDASLAYEYVNDQMLTKPLITTSAEFTRGSRFIVYKNRNNNDFKLDIVKTFKGTPNPKVITVDFPTTKLNILGSNSYGRIYKTYLYDPFVGHSKYPIDIPNAIGYAFSVVEVSNPYTSNIDLTKSKELISLIPGGITTGIWSYSNAFSHSASNSNNFCMAQILSGGNAVYLGDKECVLIKPFQTFAIKTEDPTVLRGFKFSDDIKTFNQEPFLGSGSTPVVPETRKLLRNGGNDIYQLKFKLNSVDEKEYYNHTYVVASTLFETATIKNEGELRLNENNGAVVYTNPIIYTLPENTNLKGRGTYLNRINTQSEGVSIPLVYNGYTGSYAITVDLSENGIELDKNTRNLSGATNFYFRDRKENKLVTITNDFKYTFSHTETQSGNVDKEGKSIPLPLNDRFEIFVGRTSSGIENIEESNKPESGGISDNANETKIYSRSGEQYIRFATSWNSASVDVYDMTGRKISGVKNINTKNGDYALSLGKTNSVYVVRITGDKGQVVTEKVLK